MPPPLSCRPSGLGRFGATLHNPQDHHASPRLPRQPARGVVGGWPLGRLGWGGLSWLRGALQGTTPCETPLSATPTPASHWVNPGPPHLPPPDPGTIGWDREGGWIEDAAGRLHLSCPRRSAPSSPLLAVARLARNRFPRWLLELFKLFLHACPWPSWPFPPGTLHDTPPHATRPRTHATPQMHAARCTRVFRVGPPIRPTTT